MMRSIRVNGVERTEPELLREAYGRGPGIAVNVAAETALVIEGLDVMGGIELARNAYLMAADRVGDFVRSKANDIEEATTYLFRPITMRTDSEPLERFKKGLAGAAAATVFLW